MKIKEENTMIINHNVPALNTYNKLNINNTNTNKSLEKLSSGLRINRAGDDAAGLAISEKMRAQIRGLDQAGANAQNAISLVQTAEGGLNETHAILQRMRELAVQSATDTNTVDDRQKIQGEIDQLAREITRIANTTEFNTQNLLAGGFNGVYHVGANSNQNLRMNIGAMDAFSLGVAASANNTTALAANTAGVSSIAAAGRGLEAGGSASVYAVNVVSTAAAVTTGATAINNKGDADLSVDLTTKGFTGVADTDYTVVVEKMNSTTGKVTDILYSKDGGLTYNKASVDVDDKVYIDGIELDFSAISSTGDEANVEDRWTFSVTAAKAEMQLYYKGDGQGNANVGTITDGYLVGTTAIANAQTTEITVGDTVNGKTVTLNFDMSQVTAGTEQIEFEVNDTKSTAAVTSNGYVSTEANAVMGVDVSSQGAANKAIETIDKAINQVSQERSKMGALQNRLEYTISNLATSSENLTAAESRIRDVDMAKEMMNYQKNMILAQAATSMLAQANASPQNVLKLLG